MLLQTLAWWIRIEQVKRFCAMEKRFIFLATLEHAMLILSNYVLLAFISAKFNYKCCHVSVISEVYLNFGSIGRFRFEYARKLKFDMSVLI